jgi:TetR/AcrR family transcriptional regulator
MDSTRPSDAEHDTPERLIAAATRLISAKGIDGVSVKELAEAAGVNVSLVSYHFGGKEGLYRTCLERFGEQRLAAARRILEPPSTKEELRLRLRLFVEEVWRCHIEQPDLTRIIHRECELELPQALDIFRSTFLKVLETQIEFFTVAQRKGLLKKEVDAAKFTLLFFGAMMHAGQKMRMSELLIGVSIRDPEYRRQTLNQLLLAFLEGALT